VFAAVAREVAVVVIDHGEGRFSFDRRTGFGTPRLAGLYSMTPQTTARFSI
jgi:hypothetical protein